jgi:HD-GYP domain-containing protein (c-di-GMP phosphodiesterase class II)
MAIQPGRSDSSGIRLAELMAALSSATDLGMGQPMEFALCACVLALRLADKCGYSEAAKREVYYQALLRYIGCNADSDWLASIFGDEQRLRADFSQIDNADPAALLSMLTRAIRQANEGASSLDVARAMARELLASPKFKVMFEGHCQVAQRLATRLGFAPAVVHALGQLYERWDGKGLPNGLQGEAIAPAVLVVTLAQDAALFHRLGGLDAALAVVRERRGTAYAPFLVDSFCAHAAELCLGLDEDPWWDMVLDLEPGSHDMLTQAQYDEACRALADFVDIKSRYTLTHSSGVAELAAEAARRAGLPAADVRTIWRAGLVKEIGRTGISSRIWEKTTELSEREWEQVRLHTYYCQRVLARPPELARVGGLAALHHERLDGTGYHRGLPAVSLSPAARLLAAADVYHALTEARPHRPAYSLEDAARETRRQASAGKLDGDAVNSVLAAAGHRVRRGGKEMVAGLSEREVEVLRLLARGQTIKQMAGQLMISDKTVDSHIQHIYNKIGVSTRSGATLFAMEHRLLSDFD